MNLLEGPGLESLSIQQLSRSTSKGYSIHMIQSAHGWIRNVQTNKCQLNGHVRLDKSYGNVIRDNFFNDSWGNAADQAYGIFFFGVNSENLAENNIIRRARHSLVFEGGGSGNVFGYNYAREGFEQGSNFPNSDAVAHGAHPFMNLWEGNVFGNFAGDNIWGSSSHNTLFRNYVLPNPNQSPLAAITLATHNYYQNVVGNVLGPFGSACSVSYDNTYPSSGSGGIFWLDSESLVRSSLLRTGNWDCVNQKVMWVGNTLPIPASLYLPSKPAWMGSASFPVYGPDLANGNNVKLTAVPAQKCFQENNLLSSGLFDSGRCFGASVAPPALVTPPASGRQPSPGGTSSPVAASGGGAEGFVPFPNSFNPNHESLSIRYHASGAEGLAIYDSRGNEVRSMGTGMASGGVGETKWDGRNSQGQTVSSGIYHVMLKQNGKMFRMKVAVVK
jgi:hypothetical protein